MAITTSELTIITDQFRQELERMGIYSQKILLYGSQRWGTAEEGSDIDLIVVSSDWSAYNWRERLELLGVAAARLLQPIQARGFTPEEITNREIGYLWQEILEKEAVTV
jgi:uncharacterized protein